MKPDLIKTIKTYNLRKEQEEAVKQAKELVKESGGEMLLNAKPRFGKTLATYDLCKKLNLSTNSETYYYSQLEAIDIFLNNSSYEYFVLFNDMYEKIYNNFENIIRDVEEKIGGLIPIHKKLVMVNGFYKNMDQIRNCLDKYNNKFKIK